MNQEIKLIDGLLTLKERNELRTIHLNVLAFMQELMDEYNT